MHSVQDDLCEGAASQGHLASRKLQQDHTKGPYVCTLNSLQLAQRTFFVVLVSCRPYVSGCMAEATRAAEIKVVRSYSQGWCQHDVCLWQVIA